MNDLDSANSKKDVRKKQILKLGIRIHLLLEILQKNDIP